MSCFDEFKNNPYLLGANHFKAYKHLAVDYPTQSHKLIFNLLPLKFGKKNYLRE